jgi:hypothetical protein
LMSKVIAPFEFESVARGKLIPVPGRRLARSCLAIASQPSPGMMVVWSSRVNVPSVKVTFSGRGTIEILTVGVPFAYG